MKGIANALLAAALLLGLLGVVVGGVSCGVARFGECRRVHPLWYCLSNQ